jgi:exosome complex component RRP42
VVFYDATAQEEAACPDRVHLFYAGNGKVCGIRTEGNDALDINKIKPLLLVSFFFQTQESMADEF